MVDGCGLYNPGIHDAATLRMATGCPQRIHRDRSKKACVSHSQAAEIYQRNSIFAKRKIDTDFDQRLLKGRQICPPKARLHV